MDCRPDCALRHPDGCGRRTLRLHRLDLPGETSFFLYDSYEYVVDNQIEGGLRVGYAKRDGSFEIAAFARNITDADNVKGGIDFNNNTAFVNDPRVIGLSVRIDY